MKREKFFGHLFFLSVILIPLSALAKDDESSRWFSAGYMDVQTAKCLSRVGRSETEIFEDVYRRATMEDLEQAFVDLHPTLKLKLRAADRKKTSYASLIKTRFPESYGRVLSLYLDFGFNAMQFSNSDIQSFYSAVLAMPKGFRAPQNNFVLQRVKGFSEAKVLANATLTFSDYWSAANEGKRIYAVVHELAHRMDFEASDTEEWRNISGFEPFLGGPGLQFHAGTTVSKYAQRNTWEDWAESVAAYRYNPERLSLVSSEKYNWIRWQVFGGKEFMNEGDCETRSALTPSTDLEAIADAEISSCSYALLTDIFATKTSARFADFSKCILEQQWKKSLVSSIPQEHLNRALKIADEFYRASIKPAFNDQLTKTAEALLPSQIDLFNNTCKRVTHLKYCDLSAVIYLEFTERRDLPILNDYNRSQNKYALANREMLARQCKQFCEEHRVLK